MIEMIVLDLDQTLLHTDKTISSYSISVLQACRSKGILVAFATARSTQAASKMLAQFTPDIFMGYGGALVFYGGEVIHRFDIPADVSSQLIGECLQEPGISYVLAVNESVAYTNRINPKASDTSHYRLADFTTLSDVGYLKISVVAENPEVVERIAASYPMLDLLRYSGEDLYRFASRDALKWNAVQAAADYFGISTEQIAAFGDDIIDLEMITHCGVGVAVKNAVDAVIAAADHICGSNREDGVIRWIGENAL